MSVPSFISRMRTRQAALFSSTVTITRFAGKGAFDPVTASYATGTSTTVYTGAALVRPQKQGTTESGEVLVVISGYEVKVPVDTALQVGDVVSVTGSTFDTSLVGLSLRISDVRADDWQICRVAMCVDQKARPT
jgi:pectate lyase